MNTVSEVQHSDAVDAEIVAEVIDDLTADEAREITARIRGQPDDIWGLIRFLLTEIVDSMQQ
jgi:5,10-methenyltetrahydromethanopterin hydrogenase